MRALCMTLAVVVFALCVAGGAALGRFLGRFTATLVSYDAGTILALCVAAGAVIGLLAASGYLISAALAGRLQNVEQLLDEQE